MRERLIELLEDCGRSQMPMVAGLELWADDIADYLLANGVIVPPCKIGDTVWYISGIHNSLVKSAKVEEIYHGDGGFAFHLCRSYTYFTLQQEDVFFTREEAEAKLKGGAE